MKKDETDKLLQEDSLLREGVEVILENVKKQVQVPLKDLKKDWDLDCLKASFFSPVETLFEEKGVKLTTEQIDGMIAERNSKIGKLDQMPQQKDDEIYYLSLEVKVLYSLKSKMLD